MSQLELPIESLQVAPSCAIGEYRYGEDWDEFAGPRWALDDPWERRAGDFEERVVSSLLC